MNHHHLISSDKIEEEFIAVLVFNKFTFCQLNKFFPGGSSWLVGGAGDGL